MKTYLYIGFGGFLGAIFRSIIKEFYFASYKGTPWSTLFINISGSFLLALLLTVIFEIKTFDINIRNSSTIGLLGAYTTFSGFCKDTINLISTGAYYNSIIYFVLTILLGIGAVYAGYFLANYLVMKLIRKNSNNVNDEERNNLNIEVD